MSRKISIRFRHFDRSAASGEIFEDAIFVSQFKDFSTALEMTTDTRNQIQQVKKTYQNL